MIKPALQSLSTSYTYLVTILKEISLHREQTSVTRILNQLENGAKLKSYTVRSKASLIYTGRPKSLATRDPQKLETKMSKNAFYFCLGTSGRLPVSNFPHMQTFSKTLF